MATESTRIDFDDFANDLQAVFERIRRSNEAVLIVYGEDVYRVERALGSTCGEYDAHRLEWALRESAGALRSVDSEELIRDLHPTGPSILGGCRSTHHPPYPTGSCEAGWVRRWAASAAEGRCTTCRTRAGSSLGTRFSSSRPLRSCAVSVSWV